MFSLAKPAKIRAKSARRRSLWFERLMALLALTELSIILFDMSYVPLRTFYFRQLPQLTQRYDAVKGIAPHRETERYLQAVDQLEQQVLQDGIRRIDEQQLQELRQLSAEMIDSNPFQVANKTGTLEKIKNLMREHTGLDSSTAAFNLFWSQDYLTANNWTQQQTFFNTKIRPLIASNYYRSIGEDGQPTDLFVRTLLWPFCAIFLVEFCIRTFFIHRRHAGISWLDAAFWRWYDVLLFAPLVLLPIPFEVPYWLWLCAIPVAIRLDHANLVKLERVQKQLNQGFAATLAEELTQVIVIRVIDQVQDSVKRGDLTRWLTQPPAQRPYVDLNNVNEVEAIASLLSRVMVQQVLPKIKPDLSAILQHNLEGVLNQIPLYRGMQQVPGLQALPGQLTENVANQVTQSVYEALTSSVEDTVGAELTSRLVQHLLEAIASEVGSVQTQDQLKTLVADFLEEVKINYVRRLSEQDVETILEEKRQLQQMVKR